METVFWQLAASGPSTSRVRKGRVVHAHCSRRHGDSILAIGCLRHNTFNSSCLHTEKLSRIRRCRNLRCRRLRRKVPQHSFCVLWHTPQEQEPESVYKRFALVTVQSAHMSRNHRPQGCRATTPPPHWVLRCIASPSSHRHYCPNPFWFFNIPHIAMSGNEYNWSG